MKKTEQIIQEDISSISVTEEQVIECFKKSDIYEMSVPQIDLVEEAIDNLGVRNNINDVAYITRLASEYLTNKILP